MNLKPILTALIFIIHVISLTWYLYLGAEYISDHKYLHVLLLYSPALILPALNNSLREHHDNNYQLLIYSIHNLFSLLIGSVYALYYTGVFFIPRTQLQIGCLIFIIIFIIIYINLQRYKFFKDE
jgi:hypothetical protein